MRSGPFLLACCLMLGACSRPATADECEFIVRRVAELRLAGGLDRAEARKGAAKLTRELEPEIRQECVGKPITDRALTCVRQAKEPRQVVECFH